MVEKVVEKDKIGREQCSIIQFWAGKVSVQWPVPLDTLDM